MGKTKLEELLRSQVNSFIQQIFLNRHSGESKQMASCLMKLFTPTTQSNKDNAASKGKSVIVYCFQ